MSRAVYDAVQAVLLNSESDPTEAVSEALRAVADFAESESVCEAETLADIVREAYEEAEEGDR